MVQEVFDKSTNAGAEAYICPTCTAVGKRNAKMVHVSVEIYVSTTSFVSALRKKTLPMEKEEERTAISWAYDTPAWYDLPKEAMTQLRFVHELYNHLVEQERWYQEKRHELWLTIPTVKAAWDKLEAARAKVSEIREAMKQTRVKDRTTAPPIDETELLAAAKTTLGKANEAWKTARKAAAAQFKEIEKPLRDEYQCRTRATGKCPDSNEHCLGGDHIYAAWTGRGMSSSLVGPTGRWWNTTRQAMINRRSNGETFEMRFRRWNGGDCPLRIQIQPDEGKLHDSRIQILDDTGWRGKVPPSPKRAAMYKVLRMKIGASKTSPLFTVDIPFIQHRPFPEGAQITWVQVVRRITAGRPRIRIVFTISIPKPPVKTEGAVVSLRTQWTGGDGHVRIGTVGSSREIPEPPEYLKEYVFVDASRRTMDIVAPASWYKVLKRDDAIREYRDRIFNEAKVLTGAPEAVHWRSPARLVVWMRENPDHDPKLDEWFHRNRHLWQFEAHERKQIIARKQWVYRNIAAWICSFARVVLVSDTNVKQLKQKKDVDHEDTSEARGARRNAQWATPGEFRLTLVQAAQRRGIEVEVENSQRTDS